MGLSERDRRSICSMTASVSSTEQRRLYFISDEIACQRRVSPEFPHRLTQLLIGFDNSASLIQKINVLRPG